MNGAEATLKTLADSGVEACFANPGTSEMQMVAAFDREQRMRPVLCLFEGVATGAADGYGRMADKPAATLLHLGPGLANGGANLHNARRAYTPMVNIVGDHATYHQQYDAPLQSDIESLARPHSTWVKSAKTADDAPRLAAEAVAASCGPPGGVATLILPADCAWSETKGEQCNVALPLHRYGLPSPSRQIEAAANAVRAAKKPVLLLGGLACTERALAAAGRLAAHGLRVMTDTFVSRLPRGAGRFAPDRMAYFGEMALADLAGVDLMLLASTKKPVAFFAYPAMPSILVPEGCKVETLSALHEDAAAALESLADALGASKPAPLQHFQMPDKPRGELNPYAIGDSIARWLPEEAVICDDAVTAGLPIFMQTRAAKPHDWLMLTGGAIGIGMPLAIGAAVAAPQRKVLSLNGDGAGAYTLQSLWTIAREGLDVTTVVFANHAYRILNIELTRTHAGKPGPAASKLLDLGDPRIDWLTVARGLGVPAVRCVTAEDFDSALARALATPGPNFIEAAMS
jgi:acetolactate synthase-1/2/3 large subunit